MFTYKTIMIMTMAALLSISSAAWAADGTVDSHQKISTTAGGFDGTLSHNDQFGYCVAEIGDLDGDGVTELVVGEPRDGDNGTDSGAVWILFMNSDGTVASEQKITEGSGGFTGNLSSEDYFGWSVAAIGDLNDDGVEDIVVGALFDDDGSSWSNRGAVWILFMNTDGTVKTHQKISDTAGDFTATMPNGSNFGSSITSLGDVNGDGTTALAVGAYMDDDGGDNKGAVWILFLGTDGKVDSYQKISELDGNFTGSLDTQDLFGCSVAGIGDLDDDGVPDLAVGAYGDDDDNASSGAVWILFMDPNGSVDSHQKISNFDGNFTESLDTQDHFGWSVAGIGDLDDDGIPDLAVGAESDGDGNESAGAVWILFMDPNGSVKSHQKISATEGGFTGTLATGDAFGSSVTSIGDLDGDNITDLAVGARLDHDGGDYLGAVWILFLDRGVNDDINTVTFDDWNDVTNTASFYLYDSDNGGRWVFKKYIRAENFLIDTHCKTNAGSLIPHVHIETDLTGDDLTDADYYWDWYFDVAGGISTRDSNATTSRDGLAYAADGQKGANYDYWIAQGETSDKIFTDDWTDRGSTYAAPEVNDRLVYEDSSAGRYEHATIVNSIERDYLGCGQYTSYRPKEIQWKNSYSGVYKHTHSSESSAQHDFSTHGYDSVSRNIGSAPTGTWDYYLWSGLDADVYY